MTESNTNRIDRITEYIYGELDNAGNNPVDYEEIENEVIFRVDEGETDAKVISEVVFDILTVNELYTIQYEDIARKNCLMSELNSYIEYSEEYFEMED